MANDPNQHLSRLIEQELGLPGSFETQVQQARHWMPNGVRRDAEYLNECSRLQGNPQIARQLDPNREKAARKRVRAWLLGPDPRRRRERRRVGIVLSFVVSLSLGILFLTVLTA